MPMTMDLISIRQTPRNKYPYNSLKNKHANDTRSKLTDAKVISVKPIFLFVFPRSSYVDKGPLKIRGSGTSDAILRRVSRLASQQAT